MRTLEYQMKRERERETDWLTCHDSYFSYLDRTSMYAPGCNERINAMVYKSVEGRLCCQLLDVVPVPSA